MHGPSGYFYSHVDPVWSVYNVGTSSLLGRTPCCGPSFFTRVRPHSMGETRFLVVLLENHLKKRFGVATYFCFIFIGKTK